MMLLRAVRSASSKAAGTQVRLVHNHSHHKHKGKKYSLVIFDKDGTLYNTEKVWREWLKAMGSNITATCTEGTTAQLMRRLGYNAESDTVASNAPLATQPWGELRQMVAKALVEGITPEGLHKIHLSKRDNTTAAQEALTHKHTHSHAHHGKSLIAPEAALQIVEAWGKTVNLALMHDPIFDVRKLFSTLKSQDFKIAVNTSDDRHVTVEALCSGHVDKFVDCIVAGDDGLASKPSPESVLHICKTLDVPLKETIMVGDTLADTRLRCMADLGLVVGVLSGSGDSKSLSATADVVVPDASHILDLLK